MTWTIKVIEQQLQLGRCNYEQRSFDDDTLLEGFKNIRDVIQAQKELNEIFHKRLKLLEASQFANLLSINKGDGS